MVKELILVGAGSLSKEIKCWIETSSLAAQFRVIGVIDDNQQAPGLQTIGVPYLGTVDAFVPNEGQGLVMGISETPAKLAVAEKLKNKGGCFETIVHPTAIISQEVSIGKGVILCPYSVVSFNVVLGDLVHINIASSVGHDVVVGKGTTVSSHCDIAGFVKIGTGVFFGTRTGVIPKVEIGDFAKISAGSTV